MSKAPDYLQRVAAVRLWRVAPTLWAQLGGLLWSPMMQEPWATGEEYYPKCGAHPDEPPPGENCSCGIYCFYHPETARASVSYWPQDGSPLYDRQVVGVLGCAGNLELGDIGMRAGRATVEAIFTAGAPDRDLPIPRADIAAGYGADVINVDEFEDFCERRNLIIITEDHLNAG
jgi:hypothetical protein